MKPHDIQQTFVQYAEEMLRSPEGVGPLCRKEIVRKYVNYGYYIRAIELCTETLRVFDRDPDFEALREEAIDKAKAKNQVINYCEAISHLNPNWHKCIVSGAGNVRMWWYNKLPIIKGTITGISNIFSDGEDEDNEIECHFTINPARAIGTLSYNTLKEIINCGVECPILYNNQEGIVVNIPLIKIGCSEIHNMAVEIIFNENENDLPSIGQNVLSQLNYTLDFNKMRFQYKS